MRRGRSKIRNALIIAAGSLCLLGNRGCEANLTGICAEDFAALRADVASQKSPSRGLASDSEGTHSSFTEDEQEACALWARRRLDEVQWMLDLTMKEPGLREASIDLNQIATDLVMLHGASEKGDRKAVSRQIASLEKSIPIAQEKACPTGRASAGRVTP